MEANRLEVKEVKRKEPECTAIRSSSYKNKPLKDYHIIAEKYRVLNGFKNVVIGVITGAVMLVNGWIEVDSKALQILVAVLIAGFAAFSIRALDEALMEE